MTTVFIGGSRHVSRLPADAKKRLDTMIEKDLRVIVGDANGADKAVQKHFLDAHYENVTVFCSGSACRNNLRPWEEQRVNVAKGVKGFDFYAAKDREMATTADYGFMIWDGKSPGTVLNVLRLIRREKMAVLFDTTARTAITLKTADDWASFLQGCDESFREDLRKRATREEWNGLLPPSQPSFLDSEPETPEPTLSQPDLSEPDLSDTDLETAINSALAHGDAGRVMEALGTLARGRGMSEIARTTGLSRESLYRSLASDGNPEFGTVLKVMRSLGLSLSAGHSDQPA